MDMNLGGQPNLAIILHRPSLLTVSKAFVRSTCNSTAKHLKKDKMILQEVPELPLQVVAIVKSK